MNVTVMGYRSFHYNSVRTWITNYYNRIINTLCKLQRFVLFITLELWDSDSRPTDKMYNILCKKCIGHRGVMSTKAAVSGAATPLPSLTGHCKPFTTAKFVKLTWFLNTRIFGIFPPNWLIGRVWDYLDAEIRYRNDVIVSIRFG